MAYNRHVVNKVSVFFENEHVKEVGELITRYLSDCDNVDITTEKTVRGIWVIIEEYEWII